MLIALPSAAGGRRGIEMTSLRKFSSLAAAAFEMCLRGDFWNAMTVNGLIYSTILGYDPSLALKAMEAGALGAGLSGRGPAVAAVFDRRNEAGVGELLDSWRADGSRVIATETNNRKGEGSRIE